MSRITSPPIGELVVDDRGNLSLSWLMFFNQISIGDTGTSWTPTMSGLTEVGGSATITGRYFKISQRLTYFKILITPVTNTSSVAGTTYISNFPLTIEANGVCHAATGNIGSADAGAAVASTNRIYTPAWTTVTTPVTVCGTIEAR